MLRNQGNGAGATEAYRASLAIRDRLSKSDPGNAGWQRALSIGHWKLAQFGSTAERRAHWVKVIEILEDMERRGILAPTDRQYIATAKQNLSELEEK